MYIQDRVVRTAKIVILVIMTAAAIATPVIITEDEIRAPLLTVIGGGAIIVALFHPSTLQLPSIGTIVGTMIATAGGWFWLDGATPGSPFESLKVVLILPLFLTMYAYFGVVLFRGFVTTKNTSEPYQKEREEILKEIQERLNQVTGEIRARGHHFDHTMYSLFSNTERMLAEPSETSYAWSEHDTLIGNYITERLKRTAEIAITKHPYQCKYGEIANEIASDSELLLPRIRLTMDINAIPEECPQCGEVKPSHKANCLAALCWRCKYPTPPIRRRSENASIISPQCLMFLNDRNLQCPLRGEDVTPNTRIVKRLSLPFSLPLEDEDQFRTTPSWPIGKESLKEILREIEEEEKSCG